jgi:hypothetical protein
LWTYLVERLVPGDDDFTGAVGAVVLVHMVTSGDRVDMETVARTMAEAGWKDRNGVSATARELWPTYNSLWTLAGNVGPRSAESRRDPHSFEDGTRHDPRCAAPGGRARPVTHCRPKDSVLMCTHALHK